MVGTGLEEVVVDRRGAQRFRSLLFDRVDELTLEGTGARLRTRAFAFAGDHGRLARVTTSGHSLRLTEDACATLLLPVEGRIEVAAGREVWSAAPGDVLTLMPGTRQTTVAGHGGALAAALVLMLPVGDFAGDDPLALVARAPWQGRLVRSATALRLRRYLDWAARELLDQAAPPPQGRVATGVLSLSCDLAAEMLAEDAAGGRDLGLSHRRVRQAEDLMRARASEALSIRALAHELGVSARSLQLAFQETLGASPREVLNRIRLERVRLRLADGDGPVTSVALEAGFAHLSRFAECYLRTFGERPSDTLRRARRDGRTGPGGLLN